MDWDGTLACSLSLKDILYSKYDFNIKKFKTKKLSLNERGEYGRFFIFLRPYVIHFLDQVSKEYTLYLWSYAVRNYITQCLRVLNVAYYFEDRIICANAEKMAPKDLLLITKTDLRSIIIIDDRNEIFSILNPYNSINVVSWHPAQENDSIFLDMFSVIKMKFDFLANFPEDLVEIRQNILKMYKGNFLKNFYHNLAKHFSNFN